LKTASPHFSIHASVVFQLGESLVTDATQALLELVKNSFDADASFCKLDVNTSFSDSRGAGQIIVEDDGTGMDESAIERGWLTISDSPKRSFKRDRLTTVKGRTPLGDKGLGRLGTQRLGNHLEIETRTGDGFERKLSINWDDFSSGDLLEDVPVKFQQSRTSAAKGTKITITGLRDLDNWKQNNREQLRGNLAKIISPYVPIKNFEVFAVFDGEEIDLFAVGKKLRDSALVKYVISYKDGLFKVEGYTRLDYIKPEKGKKEQAIFADLVRNDDGEAFFNFLKTQKTEQRFAFQRAKGPWWVKYEIVTVLDEMPGVELESGRVADPGPFHGEIDYFSLGAEAAAAQTAFSEAATYRKIIQTLGGIRVYRDGFGIRVAQDWLQLGSQWTSAGSYYSLKPQNTLGYIAISALSNSCLEEKTDREGFSDNAAYRNFSELLRSMISSAAEAQEFLRRGWNSYKSQIALREARLEPDSQPEDLSASVRTTVDRAAHYRTALGKVSDALTAASADSAALLQNRTNTGNQSNAAVLQGAMSRLNDAITAARAVLAEIETYLKEVSDTEKVLGLMAEQVEALREQTRQTHEVIALGLTAEALSHELSAVTSDMAQKNNQIVKYLRSSGPRDQRVLAYAEHIRSTVSSLRKELSYLAPTLQYVREKREEVDLPDLLNEMLKYHISGYSAERISMRIQNSPSTPFRVRTSKGKLQQIFENLFLNSEYWLKEDIRMNRISFGTISVALQKPVVIVSDNGRGIDPKLESSIFEPFVSGKGKGKGRGLGLFIVQQLLANENCSITLLPDRNAHGRLWRFEIDLRGMLHG
jgi:signal transduction histidine kinase